MTVSLKFLTLSTGHLASIPRASVDQVVIDSLLPVIDAEGGPVPHLPGMFLDILKPLDEGGRPIPGAAYFQLAPSMGMSKTPYVMAICAWNEARAPMGWNQVKAMAAPFKLDLPAMPRLPWLAVYVTPLAAVLGPAMMPILADLEKCIAWGLIAAETG